MTNVGEIRCKTLIRSKHAAIFDFIYMPPCLFIYFRFDHEIGLLSALCASFLGRLQFSPTVQKHAGRWNGNAKLPRGVNECASERAWSPARGSGTPSGVNSSTFWPSVAGNHHKSKQSNAFTKDE